MRRLTFVILCYFSSLPMSWAEPVLIDFIVAVVNEDVIVNSELQQEVAMAEKRLQQQKIHLPSRSDLEKQVIDNMINAILQLQIAKRVGIAVDDNSLNEAIRNIATQNRIDLSSFRQAIEQEGISFERFRDNLRKQMTIGRLQQRQVINRINVTEREIDNFLATPQSPEITEQEFHLLHILIAIPESASPEQIAQKQRKANEVLAKLRGGAEFQETAVVVSESRQALGGGDLGWLKMGEVPSLFAQPLSKMKVGEISDVIRNASGFHIIKLAGKRESQKTVITQTRVRHILLKHKETVTDTDAQSRLEKLKYRIANGEDFGELARTHSEDVESAVNGGSLGWVSPGDLVPEVEEAVNRLADNAVSEPIKSRYGWHLVQVLEHRQHDNTQTALRNNAMQQIRQRKVEEELQTWLRQLRDEAYVEYRLGK